MNFVDELRWRGMVHTMMPGTEELLVVATSLASIFPTTM
jgi:tyrosyl-tRNA synthetase